MRAPFDKIKIIGFDLDGTLVDSRVHFYQCLNYSFTQLQLDPPSFEQCSQEIGYPVTLAIAHLVQALELHLSEAKIKQLEVEFNKYAQTLGAQGIEAFPDTYDTLRALKSCNFRFFLLTSFPRALVMEILNKLHLTSFFNPALSTNDTSESTDWILTQDECEKKPNPDGLVKMLTRAKVKVEEMLYIGDHLKDIQAAEAAGIAFMGVLTGTTSVNAFNAYPHQGLFKNLTEVKHYILNHYLSDDPSHSFSHLDQIRVKHCDLELDLKPSQDLLKGKAIYTLQRKNKKATQLTLDINQLMIQQVEQSANGLLFTATPYHLGRSHPFLGQALHISLLPETTQVRVHYRTDLHHNPGIMMIQSSSQKPFILSIACPHRARHLLPCQDSLDNKFTFNAHCETEAGYHFVMGVEDNQSNTSEDITRFSYHSSRPIPSYLFAFALAPLHFTAIDQRVGIYAADTQISKMAAQEWAIIPQMLNIAEERWGRYPWTRYDILVLPGQFPYGGMENPQLTFASSVLLSGGDRGMLAKLAHEIAHAWFGNWVTPFSWSDLWLSEGLATYAENRIIETVFGSEIAEMEAYLNYKQLQQSLSQSDMKLSDQSLHRPLQHRDPEEAFDYIPYTKGFLFFMWLEKQLGRENLDLLLRQYLQEFAATGITTALFAKWLVETCTQKKLAWLSPADLEAWFYQPGLPSYAVIPSSQPFEKVTQQAQEWLQHFDTFPFDFSAWVSQQWLHFLQTLQNHPVSEKQLQWLDEHYQLTHSQNKKLLKEWFCVCIHHGYKAMYPILENYLKSVGTMSLIIPLYQALVKAESKDYFLSLYQQAKSFYHPVLCHRLESLFEPFKTVSFFNEPVSPRLAATYPPPLSPSMKPNPP